MKRGMTIEYLKCRKDLSFEVDFRVNNNNNNNIYLKFSIQTSSIDYKKYNNIYN